MKCRAELTTLFAQLGPTSCLFSSEIVKELILPNDVPAETDLFNLGESCKFTGFGTNCCKVVGVFFVFL